MRRSTGVWILCLATAAAGAGCKSGRGVAAGDGGASAVSSSTDPAAAQASQVLARVGDHTVTVAEFVAALQHMDQFDRLRYQAPERRQELLGEMIDVMLLADEARAKGYDKDPITEQEIREILRDAMLEKAHEGAPAPSAIPDDESRAYYEQHRADFHDPERRRLSVIVVPSEAAAAGLIDAARKASPAQWGELVRTRSVDARARANVPPEMAGDLGFVSPPGDPRGVNQRVPDEVRAATFEIAKVGDVLSRPVRTSAGFYIVKWTARTEPHDRSYDDAKRAIQVKLAAEKMRAKEDALVEELRKQYPVEIDDAALGEVPVDLPADVGRDASADGRP